MNSYNERIISTSSPSPFVVSAPGKLGNCVQRGAGPREAMADVGPGHPVKKT